MQIRLPIPDAVRLELDTCSCSESGGRRPPCNDGAGQCPLQRYCWVDLQLARAAAAAARSVIVARLFVLRGGFQICRVLITERGSVVTTTFYPRRGQWAYPGVSLPSYQRDTGNCRPILTIVDRIYYNRWLPWKQLAILSNFQGYFVAQSANTKLSANNSVPKGCSANS